VLAFQRAITRSIWSFQPSVASVWSSQPSLKHIVGSFFSTSWRLWESKAKGLKIWRLEEKRRRRLCCGLWSVVFLLLFQASFGGSLSLFVIPSRLWRLVVFQFCFVNFVAAKWGWLPTRSCLCCSRWWGTFAGHRGFDFRSQLPDGSARGLAVPFYPSDACGLLSPTFTRTC